MPALGLNSRRSLALHPVINRREATLSGIKQLDINLPRLFFQYSPTGSINRSSWNLSAWSMSCQMQVRRNQDAALIWRSLLSHCQHQFYPVVFPAQTAICRQSSVPYLARFTILNWQKPNIMCQYNVNIFFVYFISLFSTVLLLLLLPMWG